MKKLILRIAIVASAMAMSTQTHAQLGNVLKNAAGSLLSSSTSSDSNSTLSTAINAVTNLLGKKEVSAKNLVGTWTYSEPCVAFESQNVLTNLGGSVASQKVEKTLSDKLKLIGFTKGKVVLTLNENGEGTVKVNKREQSVTWTVDGSNLVLTLPTLNKSIKMNANLSGNNLQLAMDASKLLTLLNAISDKASAVNSNMSTITSLLKNVNGMYLGLKFTK